MTIQEEIDSLKAEKAKLEGDMKEYREKTFLEHEISNLKYKDRIRKIKKRFGFLNNAFRIWGVIFKFCWGIIKGIFVYMQQATQNYQVNMEKQAHELEKKKKIKDENM